MPLYDERGRHTGYAKIARDLTDRVALEEALQAAHDNLEFKVEERTSELNESNESLRAEVIDRKESERLRVAMLRRIVSAQEGERKRIAREIHDHVGQQIIGLKLHLKLLQKECANDSRLNDKVAAVESIVEQIDADIDFLAWELRPSVLNDLGLAAALKEFVEEWSVQFQIPAECHVTSSEDKRLPPEIEINLYRICQEALNNICKHAEASNVLVQLKHQDGKIFLVIEDDGVGFEPSEKAVCTGNDRGMGLLGMKERTELMGGQFEIETATGKGTAIYVRVPVHFETSKTQR